MVGHGSRGSNLAWKEAIDLSVRDQTIEVCLSVGM